MSDFETNRSEISEKRTVNAEFENTLTKSHLTNIDLEEVNNTTKNLDDQKCSDGLSKIPMSANRHRKNVSPTSCVFNEVFIDPQSPSASSTTSQATSANDATFEPTIEMMVNDFDDEQTLNEEEALASLESQDPDEEINTLKKESDMPLEELLAKYRALPTLPPPNLYSEPVRKKQKKSSSHKAKQKQKHNQDVILVQNPSRNEENIAYSKVSDDLKYVKTNSEEIVSAKHFVEDKKADYFEEKSSDCVFAQRKPLQQSTEAEQKKTDDNVLQIQSDIHKVRRSHLMDLYPEGMFDNVAVGNETIAGNSKEIFYDAGDEEDYEENEEEDEDFKKKVMIGTAYQATIPIGLSQYGDVLPYENEDKLIWEPCQVSEREVEEYLIKIREIKSNQQGGHHTNSVAEANSENLSKESGRSEKSVENLENNSFLANGDTFHVESTTMEADNQAVVKDNEQALHLLVQCGYDFKEALRRKRLNALPLNDCMSLWSEEECHKFEEGIQKYGKDFLKIRQNQVRTRTMRELVQFYYLWKKSERRDHNFANADTVDHMDIYLNEDNDYGSTPASVVTPLGSPVGNNSNTTANARNITSQKNISIMSTALATTNINTEKSGSSTCLQQHNKRRTNTCNQSNLSVPANEFNGDNSSKVLTNISK